MTPKEKAEDLVRQYRMLLMNEGEDYGEEIIVSMLSKKCALIAVDELINAIEQDGSNHVGYWLEVEKEIEKL